tara:strand:+ start:161 stop:373 length:213 start_codon:yes stop_codon:yes gene_type:complete
MQLIVLDYKSQAKNGVVDKEDYLDDPYHNGYKIQINFYAYLLKERDLMFIQPLTSWPAMPREMMMDSIRR